MKKIKMLVLALSIGFMLCLSGCKIIPANTYEMLKPPQLSGDYYPIGKALSQAAGNQYILRYPASGNHRSAITLCDITGDGEKEAIAFYSNNSEELHINLIVKNGKDWNSADDQTVTAGGVEKIDFCDLDGDGKVEVFVGWEMPASAEKQLAVYSFSDGKLIQRMLQKYSEFIFSDLDGDETDELFVQQLNTTDSTNRAVVYKLEKGKVIEFSSAPLDRGVKSIFSITENTLTNGQSAVYIDEIKNSGAITEVLFLNKGQLVNPMVDITSGENIYTSRSAALMCKDINHDGILEIPIFEEIPSADGQDTAEKIYSTNWCAFTGDLLVPKQTEIINQNDGYSLRIPDKWVGNIAVASDSKFRIRTFYLRDAEGNAARRILDIRSYKEKEFKEIENNLGEDTAEVCRIKDTVVVGKVYKYDDGVSITMDELKKLIYLTDDTWEALK